VLHDTNMQSLFGWTFCRNNGKCCRNNGFDDSEVLLTLSSDHADLVPMRSAVSRADSLDVTFTPRSVCTTTAARSATPTTPRQRSLKDSLELPLLDEYPMPPDGGCEDDEGARRQKLLQMYREFAMDLHTGMHLTQLSGNMGRSTIHCQLMDDLQTFKIDQANGRIVEFPLAGVSRVFRTALKGEIADTARADHIVVVAFDHRQLAFVFWESLECARFLMSIELLIRRAQQKLSGKQQAISMGFRRCTPRQVEDNAESHAANATPV